MTSATIVQKLWNYCNILRDDGLSCGDYPSAESILSAAEGLRTGSEQLTYLLFLKMADEWTKHVVWNSTACPRERERSASTQNSDISGCEVRFDKLESNKRLR